MTVSPLALNIQPVLRTRRGYGLAAVVGVLCGYAAMAVPAMASDPVIMAAGDIACPGTETSTGCRQKYTSDLLVTQRDSAEGLTAVLPLGDLQYLYGSLTDFQQFFDPTWGRVKSLMHPIPGDGEYENPADHSGSGYFDYFNGVGGTTGPAGERTKGYYSWDLGSWHMIALNTNDECVYMDCRSGSAQEQWLKQDLAANSQPCILAYMHSPLAERDGVEVLWKALYAAGADVVLAGHHHTYQRSEPRNPAGAVDQANGIREFIVGTGGKDGPIFGVIKMTLHPAGYDWTFAGQGTSDSGTGTCRAATPPAIQPSPPPQPPPPPPPPPTAPGTTLPGSEPTATGAGAPEGPPAAVLSDLRVAAVQTGSAIRGAVTIGRGGSSFRAEVRTAKGAAARVTRAGLTVSAGVPAGRLRFVVRLTRRARATLRRQRRMRMAVRVTAVPPAGRAVLMSRRVLVRASRRPASR